MTNTDTLNIALVVDDTTHATRLTDLMETLCMPFSVSAVCQLDRHAPQQTDYTQLLATSIEAVVIMIHGSPADLVCQALRANKHVFCQPTLGYTLRDVSAIEQAQRESGNIVMICDTQHASPGFNKARNLCSQLPPFHAAKVAVLFPKHHTCATPFGGPRFDDPRRTAEEREECHVDPHVHTGTRYRDVAFTSLLHCVRMIRALFGEPFATVSVQAYPPNTPYPTVTVTLDYAARRQVVLTWTYLSQLLEQKEQLSVYDRQKCVTLNVDAPTVMQWPVRANQRQEGELGWQEAAIRQRLLAFYHHIRHQIAHNDVAEAQADIGLLEAVLHAHLAVKEHNGLIGAVKRELVE